MLRIRVASCVLVLIGLLVGPRFACAESGAPAAQSVGLAIIDFEYVDTSGEPVDQTAIHQRRLQAFMAKILVIGGIHKKSTLVQWAKVTAIDVAADRVVADRLFTFRGDSDEAWERAEVFVSREIRTALAAR
jgi:hypothetical protein